MSGKSKREQAESGQGKQESEQTENRQEEQDSTQAESGQEECKPGGVNRGKTSKLIGKKNQVPMLLYSVGSRWGEREPEGTDTKEEGQTRENETKWKQKQAQR